MPGGGEPEIIGEQSCELYPKQAALCKHTAMLFQAVAEIGLQSVIHDDQCFPEESAVFGTADVESVAQLGQVPQARHHLQERSAHWPAARRPDRGYNPSSRQQSCRAVSWALE